MANHKGNARLQLNMPHQMLLFMLTAVLQMCPANMSCRWVLQMCLAGASCKTVLQMILEELLIIQTGNALMSYLHSIQSFMQPCSLRYISAAIHGLSTLAQ